MRVCFSNWHGKRKSDILTTANFIARCLFIFCFQTNCLSSFSLKRAWYQRAPTVTARRARCTSADVWQPDLWALCSCGKVRSGRGGKQEKGVGVCLPLKAPCLSFFSVYHLPFSLSLSLLKMINMPPQSASLSHILSSRSPATTLSFFHPF